MDFRDLGDRFQVSVSRWFVGILVVLFLISFFYEAGGRSYEEHTCARRCQAQGHGDGKVRYPSRNEYFCECADGTRPAR